MTATAAKVVGGLPEGVGICDLSDYYVFGGYEDDALDRIENDDDGYCIEADGTLSEGWRYLMLDVRVSNVCGRAGEVCFGDVVPVVLVGEPDGDGVCDAVRCSKRDGHFIWRSHHEKPGWDTRVLFAALGQGETRTFQLLFAVPEQAAVSEGLGVMVKDAANEAMGRSERWRVIRLGALA